MQLRDYQSRAVADIRAALAAHRSVVLALQVGGGKTVVACEVIRRVLAAGKRALFVVHRVELVEQARDRLAAFGIRAGVIKAGIPEHRDRPVQVACVPTLVRRDFPPADLVILDETHHAVSASWLRVVQHYRDDGAFVLGITATPMRLDGRRLGDAFQAIIEPVTTRELIDGGYLIEPTVYAPPVDLSGIGTRGGDYKLPELAERVSPLCGHVIQTWAARARTRPTLAFAVNVEHSRLMEAAFSEAGARVAHVDGKSSKRDRKRANAYLRNGRLDVVTQCAIWTEGVDIPELSCLVLARPTKSLSLHRQMIGRVMRTSPGKADALVLDHAGNTLEHGLITDEIEWSLDGEIRRPSGAPPVTQCPECFAILPLGVTECPECGSVKPPRSIEAPGVDNPGELVRIDMRPRKATAQEKAAEYREIVRDASTRGYKLGWARLRYKDRFDVWPRFREIEEEEYRCAGHEMEVKALGPRIVTRCGRCFMERARA